MLIELPNELLTIIIEDLPTWDIASLNCTCSRLHNLVENQPWWSSLASRLAHQRKYNQQITNTRWYGTGYSYKGQFGAEISDALLNRIRELTPKYCHGSTPDLLPTSELDNWYYGLSTELYVNTFYRLDHLLINDQCLDYIYQTNSGLDQGIIPMIQLFDESLIPIARRDHLLQQINEHMIFQHVFNPRRYKFTNENITYCGPDMVRCPICGEVFTTTKGRTDIGRNCLILGNKELREYLPR